MPLIVSLPFVLQIWALACGAMLVPAGYAAWLGDVPTARAFGNAALAGGVMVVLLGLALAARPRRASAMRQLLQLLGAFLVLPVFLALPFHTTGPGTSYVASYLEMTSAMTTTGVALFPAETLGAPLHLWRALVGWLGGGLMWVAAAAVLAPLALGGFELTQGAGRGVLQATGSLRGATTDPQARVVRAVRVLAPLYTMLTAALALALIVVGEDGFVALCHAMAVMATSGITPLDSSGGGQAGLWGEALILLFLVFALSRISFAMHWRDLRLQDLTQDPELRMALSLGLGVPLLLFLRHWWGAIDNTEPDTLALALRALWGGVFTVVSFLATLGFESADWATARMWSNLGTPGMILMGLALIGGGVATTAGGVKLLRVFALYLNGLREVERLVHPSSVTGGSEYGGRIRRDGQVIAWVFFMLVAIALAVVTTGLGLMGVAFGDAVLLAVASVSNTGPLITAAAETPIDLLGAGAGVQIWLAVAMVLGRLEVLAIIVLLVPASWRS